METIVNQIYKHYKGGIYQVLAIDVKHTERDEEFVIYKSCDSDDVFARPKSMFEETITIDGVEMERFERISGGIRQKINTKMTGRDKLNAMSNEELANHLAECCYCHEYGSENYLCDGYDNGYCNKCILNTLESELKEP